MSFANQILPRNRKEQRKFVLLAWFNAFCRCMENAEKIAAGVLKNINGVCDAYNEAVYWFIKEYMTDKYLDMKDRDESISQLFYTRPIEQKNFAWNEYDNIYFNGTQITALNIFVYQYIYKEDSTEYTREFEQYERKVKEICHTLCIRGSGLLYSSDTRQLEKVKTELDQLICALNPLQSIEQTKTQGQKKHNTNSNEKTTLREIKKNKCYCEYDNITKTAPQLKCPEVIKAIAQKLKLTAKTVREYLRERPQTK